MKLLPKIAVGALMGAATLATTAASAEIVCNADGDCWHVHRHYVYQPDWNITVHPDDWTWPPDAHYRWHEHHGRGYWRGGVWIRF